MKVRRPMGEARPSPLIDAATALSIGCRDRQEDALVTSFPLGSQSGIAVLSDGMGGHGDGDLAGRLIVSRVFGDFLTSGGVMNGHAQDIRTRLERALKSANTALRDHIDSGLGDPGMGGTLVVATIEDGQLHWLSVGDSALYLFRDGDLTRLNTIHSLAPQIDKLVACGEMDPETARKHPQRSCLTSAVSGIDIAQIDLPEISITLQQGDIVLMASDGLESLRQDDIRDIFNHMYRASSHAIAQALMTEVDRCGDPEQDNTSVIVIKPHICTETLGWEQGARPLLPVKSGSASGSFSEWWRRVIRGPARGPRKGQVL